MAVGTVYSGMRMGGATLLFRGAYDATIKHLDACLRLRERVADKCSDAQPKCGGGLWRRRSKLKPFKPGPA